MQTQPKPSALLVAVSLVVIAGCLLVVSWSLAAFASWNPCSVLGGMVILPLPVVLAIQQYRGTFRRARSAAKTSAVLLFLVAGFAGFSFVSTLGKMVLEAKVIPWRGLPAILAPMLVLAMVAAAAGGLNRRWARSLPKIVEGSQRWQFSLKELFGFLTAVALLSGLTAWLIPMERRPQYAEHVERADAPFGLPEGAVDISYCEGLRGMIAYEFTITESAFRQWVDSGIGSLESEAADVPLLSITEPVTIGRYNALSADLTGADSITVSAGLHYSWSYEDRGVYAVFDSTTSRAYYYAHFH